MRVRCHSTGTAVLLGKPQATPKRACLKHTTCLAAAVQVLSICGQSAAMHIAHLPQGRPSRGEAACLKEHCSFKRGSTLSQVRCINSEVRAALCPSV